VNLALILFLICGCKPDDVAVEIYASDILLASSESIVEVPIVAKFSMLGDDDEGLLTEAASIAEKYLGEQVEFNVVDGDLGASLVIECNLPMGSLTMIENYADEHRSPIALVVETSPDHYSVEMATTNHFNTLNSELSDLNWMLGIDFPGTSTRFRIVGDREDAPTFYAVAVFVNGKAELWWEEEIPKRRSTEIEFSGESGSVYAELNPVFFVRRIVEASDSD